MLGFVSLIASFVIFSCEKPANVTPISGEDRKQYISGYMELIKKATISENSKRVVLEGTSTAVNSLML